MDTQKNIPLKVIGYDMESRLFKVELDGREYSVRQTGKETPEYITCRVFRNDDEVEVAPEIETYFHSGALRRFTVRSDMRESAGVYELVDDCGFVVYLYGAEEYSFFKGKQLLCTVISTDGARPYVVLRDRREVTGSAFSIPKEFLKGLFGEKEWDADSLCDLILYDGMDDPYDVKCYEWVISCTSIYHEKDVLESFLFDVRGTCMDILENSDLLSRCEPDEVTVLSDRMTLVIEHMGYVKAALNAIAEGKESEYIIDAFQKLKKSGFLYHPAKHFCIITYLFRIKPELMNSMIDALFDVVRSHGLPHWKKEPFRTELIKQLEAYIKKNEKDAGQTPDNKGLYYKGFQALAIQNLLAGDEEDLIDVPLNRSMMYRYASHLQYANRRRMADMSINSLLGLFRKRICYSLADTATPDKLYYLIDNWGRSQEVDMNYRAVYRSRNLVLTIEDGKIVLAPDVELELKSALYDDTKLWHGIDVLLEKQYATPPYRQKGSDLMQLNAKLWRNVDDCLFAKERSFKKKEIKVKSIPEIGDYALAYVYKQDEGDPNKFYCRIDDEEKSFVGEGIIHVKGEDDEPGIVAYYPEPTMDNFMDDAGNPYLIEMRVAGKTEDNICILDLKSVIEDTIKENKPDFQLECEVGKVLTDSTCLAVSKEGIPVFVTFSPQEVYIASGDHITVHRNEKKWFMNGFVQAEYSKKSEVKFTLNEAFGQLIEFLEYKVLRLDLENLDSNEVNLERTQVMELLNIIDEVVSVEEDNHAAYNYLGFAMMISKMIGSEDRTRYYRGQMAVAQMLHKFAVTNDVDDEKLHNLWEVNRDLLNTNYNLRYQFNRLLAVSYMGGENNDWLVALSKDGPDENLRKLASLVFSYNVLLASGLDATDVKKTIKDLLKLKGRDAYFKIYEKGEGEDVEFKTSIVYPPESMKPDIVKQTRNIMKEICAFLNHRGGTLYLGVNDEGGGEGLEEDMKYEDFRDSRDKYDNYVRNQIVLQLGQEASHCVEGVFDDDARGRDVYVLNIKPCEHPVQLDGKYYQRQGSSSRQIDKDYLPVFKNNRQAEYRQLMKERGIEVAGNAAVQTGMVSDVLDSSLADSVHGTEKPALRPLTDGRIKTSVLRNNLLHDYEDGYVYAEAYIRILDNHKYMLEQRDNHKEDSSLLTLAVHGDETDGYLLLVYEDASVSKIPMGRILDKLKGKVYNRYNGASLVFACPAGNDDVLYQCYEYKGERYYRFQEIADIEEGNIGDSGKLLTDSAFDSLLACDVIPSDRKEILPKRTSDRKRLGYTGSKKDSTKCEDALNALGLRVQ